ncbi:MAG TPA: VTT domain-containing protein [Thermoanaerobaculia bacterium]|nr:VTT domain-containing protein [Thermoanaerobaculia bacterium]
MREALFTPRVRRLLPLLAVAVPIIAVAIAATRLGDLPAVRAVLTSLRSVAGEWWAVPLFVVAYVVFALLLLPVGLLSATGVLVWGWKFGGALDLVSATIAALPPFLLARGGLARWMERRIRREDLPALDSPFVLFLLRIVPIVPYVALNYIAGSATRVRTRDFLLMTFVGSVPSVFLFAWFVDTVAAGASGVATEVKIFGVCAVIAVVAIALRWVADRFVRRRSA